MTPEPPYWRVSIDGRDLELVSKFDLPEVAIIKDDERAYLVADEFAQLNDSTKIWTRARELLSAINGAASVEYGSSFRPLTLGSVERRNADGTIDGFVMATTARLTIAPLRATLIAVVRAADGTIRYSDPPEPIGLKALRHAVRNADVGYVIDLLNEPSWANLYKIHERMRDVLASNYHSVTKRSKPEMSCFVQTANRFRHVLNVKKCPRPSSPPSHDGTIKFYRQNVRRWIESLDVVQRR